MASTSNDIIKIDRKLQYKQLMEKGAQIGEALSNQNVIDSLTHIMDIVNNCENISTGFAREAKVENTGDYLMDAQIIKMSHDLMDSMTEKMANNDFREDEYIKNLVNMMANDPNKILETAIVCCQSAKFQLSMLGTFDLDDIKLPLEVIKKVRQRSQKTLEPKAAPENIKQITKIDKGAEKINIVQSELKRVFQLRNVKHIPYYEVIINPHDFMKTIDTAFQISFLIRDGILGIDLIDNIPHLCIKKSPKTSQSQFQDPNNTRQAIMSLNPARWRKEIQKYNIQTPLLNITPDKEEHNHEDEDSD